MATDAAEIARDVLAQRAARAGPHTVLRLPLSAAPAEVKARYKQARVWSRVVASPPGPSGLTRGARPSRSSRACCTPTRRGAPKPRRLSKVRLETRGLAAYGAITTALTLFVQRARRAVVQEAFHALSETQARRLVRGTRGTRTSLTRSPRRMSSRRRSLRPPDGRRPSARTARGSSRRKRRAPPPCRTRHCRHARDSCFSIPGNAATPADS